MAILIAIIALTTKTAEAGKITIEPDGWYAINVPLKMKDNYDPTNRVTITTQNVTARYNIAKTSRSGYGGNEYFATGSYKTQAYGAYLPNFTSTSYDINTAAASINYLFRNVGTFDGQDVDMRMVFSNFKFGGSPASLNVSDNPYNGFAYTGLQHIKVEITYYYSGTSLAINFQPTAQSKSFITMNSLNGLGNHKEWVGYLNRDGNNRGITEASSAHNFYVSNNTNVATGTISGVAENAMLLIGVGNNFTDQLGASDFIKNSVSMEMIGTTQVFYVGITDTSCCWQVFSNALMMNIKPDAPTKKVDADEFVKVGQTLNYTLEQSVGKLGIDMIRKYDKMVVTDDLPAELQGSSLNQALTPKYDGTAVVSRLSGVVKKPADTSKAVIPISNRASYDFTVGGSTIKLYTNTTTNYLARRNITVQFLDTVGKKIQDDSLYQGYDGCKETITVPEIIKNYITHEPTQTITIEKDSTIKFIYEKLELKPSMDKIVINTDGYKGYVDISYKGYQGGNTTQLLTIKDGSNIIFKKEVPVTDKKIEFELPYPGDNKKTDYTFELDVAKNPLNIDYSKTSDTTYGSTTTKEQIDTNEYSPIVQTIKYKNQNQVEEKYEHFKLEAPRNIIKKAGYGFEYKTRATLDSADLDGFKLNVPKEIVDLNISKTSFDLDLPTVWIEPKTGKVFASKEKANLIDGGHKIYIPLFADQGQYDASVTSEAIGINKFTLKYKVKIDVPARMLLEKSSRTKAHDDILIAPVYAEKANGERLAKNGFTQGEIDWINS
jgi:hypothetical protein